MNVIKKAAAAAAARHSYTRAVCRVSTQFSKNVHKRHFATNRITNYSSTHYTLLHERKPTTNLPTDFDPLLLAASRRTLTALKLEAVTVGWRDWCCN